MPCYHPLKARRDADGIHFVARGELHNLKLPCGRCFGCRMERSRQWAVRCMHEAQMHRHNCFLTVTYATENLPPHGSLVKRHHQLFLKKLRAAVNRQRHRMAIQHPPVGGWPFALEESTPQSAPGAPDKTPGTPGAQLRYYMAGEYGAELARPHYHFCIFGIDFNDRTYWKTTAAGSKLYRSATLEKLWPEGHSTVGNLTFESAAYTARYCLQKRTGEKFKKHYEKIDIDTGEIIQLEKEYNEMSRAKGIGKEWITKFTADAYIARPGEIRVNGKTAKTPRYYDQQLKKLDPTRYEIILDHRTKEARKHAHDSTPKRLQVKEIVAKAKLRNLKREL